MVRMRVLGRCLPTDTIILEGFNIAVYEWMETIPSLWPTVKGS